MPAILFRTVFFKFLLTIFLVCAAQAGFAKGTFHTFNIVLLQPDPVLQQRVPNVAMLAAYIKAIEKSVARVIESSPKMESAGGFIVVALKPGNKSQVWLDFKSGLSPRTQDTIKSTVKAVRTVSVNGLVVFAIKVGLNGGAEPIEINPSPEEWKATANKIGRTVEVSNLVEMVWPD